MNTVPPRQCGANSAMAVSTLSMAPFSEASPQP
jgi:hypothetical protein